MYDYNSNIGSYTGYPLFEELTGTADQQAQWKENRFNAYTGSRLHFMRCWYDSTLADEGYELELLDGIGDQKKGSLKDPYDSKYYALDSGDVEISIKGKLHVKYKNQLPDQKYLLQNKFPLTAREQISVIDINADGFVNTGEWLFLRPG